MKKMNGVLPNGNHYLGHGNSQRLGLRLLLLPGANGAQTKRVSVLDCDHRVHGSLRSNGSEERGSHLQGHLQRHS